ncbi:MAG: DUF4124 domain-containing protein [Deltaproteobacteria bacterium]|nr:MAG: DUF4124 domain-containing protein [Deltaproteobacteria bacterium]
MRRVLIYFGLFPLLLLTPLSLWSGEVYKWVDEKGTVHLTDDPIKIPEKHRPQTETILVPDKYAEPTQPPEKRTYPSLVEPEVPAAKEPAPRSGSVPFEEFKFIQEGMSEAEVLSRLGPPTRETADEVEVSGRRLVRRESLVKRYYYLGDPDLGERTTVIHFKNGIVQRIERIFPPTW